MKQKNLFTVIIAAIAALAAIGTTAACLLKRKQTRSQCTFYDIAE